MKTTVDTTVRVPNKGTAENVDMPIQFTTEVDCEDNFIRFMINNDKNQVYSISLSDLYKIVEIFSE